MTVQDVDWKLTDDMGGALSARWYRWARSAPRWLDPIRDREGKHGGRRQPRDVWFLAGNFGGRVVRHCTVPAGTPVFFPVINQWWTLPGGWSRVPEVLTATAHLDGVPLEVTEYVSPAFHHRLWFHRCWGMWSAIAPLSPGSYLVDFRAETTDGFWLDVVYHLTVE
ncbi:hypothetical protein ACGF1Z_04315 [Streptomyces sp. NPDC048018]|uniref:hypothetical protein n=1 Tax=Streptomyces sp. NPDC048018 TaxID=3365499 RepID=UPI003717997F